MKIYIVCQASVWGDDFSIDQAFTKLEDAEKRVAAINADSSRYEDAHIEEVELDADTL